MFSMQTKGFFLVLVLYTPLWEEWEYVALCKWFTLFSKNRTSRANKMVLCKLKIMQNALNDRLLMNTIKQLCKWFLSDGTYGKHTSDQLAFCCCRLFSEL